MIEGFGVDIVEVKRIKVAMKKFGARFLDKIFTGREVVYCKSRSVPEQHLAARFAAKEAVYKAFGGDGDNPIAWTDIEIINDEHGRPLVVLTGTAKKLMVKRKVRKVVVSLSHTKNYAVGNCILLKND